jgi:hypothetical protein
MKIAHLILFTILSLSTIAQEKKEKIIFFGANYELQLPQYDLKDDFGASSGVGLDLSLLSSKNIFYSLSGVFMFGNNVKDTTILDHLMDDNRNVIDQNGQIADITLQQRGYTLSGKLGYLFPIKSSTSGILGYGSLGFHEHKTRIDVRNSSVPQLDEEYKKIYDQLRNGLSYSLFLGYMHISENKFSHLYLGVEYTNALTENRRSYNYISEGAIEGVNNDSYLSIKVGWIIPISKRSSKEYYYF